MKKYPHAKEADIAVLLEGSYPFVMGGVSQWVHQIIQNFPEYRFALIFLGSAPEFYKEGIRYKLAKNVVHFQIDYLFAEEDIPAPKPLKGNEKNFEKIKTMHELFRNRDSKLMEKIGDLSRYFNKKTGVDYRQFLYSKASWDFITDHYTQFDTDPSFIDYFWTIKNLHKPLWILAKIVENIPKVKVVHTISTGYAGLLGTLINYRRGYPLILTEHGIYTKERRIDIFQSKIFRDYSSVDNSIVEISYLRDLWNRYFETLAWLCYEAANPVLSLFKAAHQLQLEGGAAPDKSFIVPNGVDIARFSKLRRPFKDRPMTIGFIGRIVPIKDVKTFIRSIVIVHDKIPDIKVLIVGSTDEDPAYAQECRDLVEILSLQNIIQFKPHQAIDEIFPQIKLTVLSSISESMPLVVLESFAAGVPLVATDVGASRELVFGMNEEDQKIGASGKIVRIADPDSLAAGIIAFLTDPQLWEQASQAAIKRAEKFYDEKIMIDRYSKIYKERMG